MIKLLIAEDELLSLEDLENLPWASAGIDAVFTAENGAAAYSIALKEKPEIILTDIQMPKMSGLELSEKISSILPETKFIFLTAHDNFDYAKAAVENQVLSYILKPFDEAELLSAAKKAADLIKRAREKISYQLRLANQLERSRHFLMGYFFGTLESNEEDMRSLLQILNIAHPEAYYTAIVITLIPSKGTGTVFTDNYQTFMEITRLFDAEGEDVLSFFNASHLVYFVAGNTTFSPTEPQTVVFKLANAAKTYLDKSQYTDYLITIGNSAVGIKHCESSYRSALDAIAYSFYLGQNTIICIADVEPANRSTDYYYSLQDEQLFNLVKAGNFEGARFLLHRMFRSFAERNLSINEVQHICHSILVRLALCLLQCGQNPDFLFNKTNVLDIVRRHNSANDLEAFMIDTIDIVTSNIAMNNSQKSRELITSIQEYIGANPKTSLTKIAEYLHHSPNYLSRIFSKETGSTIKNFIVDTRIACAKELLKSSSKSIGQIAEEVGYKNHQHFSTIFNKVTGMPPSDYRSFNTDK